MSKTNNLFATDEWTGRRLFCADGPSQRFNTTRDEQHLTDKESRTTFGDSTWKEEQYTINTLATYFNMGYKLRENESAEDFIARVEEAICIKS